VEKIKDPKVRRAILDHLHTLMFMSINPNETIKSSRHMGGRWWWRVLITYNWGSLKGKASLKTRSWCDLW
jgi:hypothetical protein